MNTLLIGDVVGSRTISDRAALHRALATAVVALNEELAPPVPLRITVGDEYQGGFASVGEATYAALRMRCLLFPHADVRHGIGRGSASVLSEEPRVEDGPGWWAAREAIDEVARLQTAPTSRHLRTAYALADEAQGPQPELVNSALAARDELVGRLGAPSMSVLAGMLEGMSQQELAERARVTPSAMSQRIRRDGLGTIVRVTRLLRETR